MPVTPLASLANNDPRALWRGAASMDPATWDFPEAELELFPEKAGECQAASAGVPRVLAEEQCPDREVVADLAALEAPPAVAVPAV